MALGEQELSECMINLGYIPKRTPPKFNRVFIGEVQSEFGTVKVQIEDICEELIPYPKAYIIELPAELESKFLPHLNFDKSLCYLDEETTSLWVIDPETTLATFVEAIKTRIQEWGKDTIISRDFQQELTSYWNGEYLVFDVSNDRESGVYAFYKRQSINGEEETEVVLSNTMEDAHQWIKKRKGKLSQRTGVVIPVDFRQPPVVPHSIDWPPKDFSDFISWLSYADPSAKSSLTHKLVKIVDKKGLVFISLRYQDEIIGFSVDMTRESIAIIQRFKPKKNCTKNKQKRHSNIHQALASIARLSRSFTRANIKDVSTRFIVNRNRNTTTDTGLEGKRVALIGCGTIGSYTAHALIQIGAGSGAKSELHLYDDDILGPGNLGRHLLGVEYLQEQKSYAVKHFLDNQGIANSIVGHGSFCKEDIVKRWDVIIDATGHTEFSLNLSHWVNTPQWNSKRPALIHGWIDGYGLAARALLNTAGTACFGCLTVEIGETRKPRFELFKSGNEPNHSEQFRRGCGKTYMPFSTQPSLSAAGMIQQLCLQTGPTFLQARFSNQVVSVKNQKLMPLSNCSICSK